MFWKKDEKLETIKDLVGSRAAYLETVKMLELEGEGKEIFLRASIEVKKKKPNQDIIERAYAILIGKSYQGEELNENQEFTKEQKEEPLRTDDTLTTKIMRVAADTSQSPTSQINKPDTDTHDKNSSSEVRKNHDILAEKLVKETIGTSQLFMDYLNNHNFSHNKKTILSDAYLFLQKKSTNSDSINKAYNIINGFDIDKIKDNNDTVSEQNVSSNILYTQDLSNKITKNLGLEQINNFSLSNFFSEAFRKHHADEAEKLLSVGTPDTTPIPNHNMGNMPKPWIFFRALVGTLITYLIFLAAWHSYNNIYLIPGLIILGSFAVPFSVLILFFELNTPKNISMLKVIQFVVIGGAISLFISLILFDLTSLDKFFGAASAGFIEESAKLFAVLVLVKLNQKKQYNYLLNALLFGAAVGTGFAAFESAGYALNIGLTSTDVMTDNIQLRGALSPFSHIIWTAIAAFAYWKAKPYYNSLWGTLISYRFIKIFLIPVTLHFIWNLPFEGPFMIKYILLGFVGWVVIISFVEEGLKEISNIIKNVKNDTPKNIS